MFLAHFFFTTPLRTVRSLAIKHCVGFVTGICGTTWKQKNKHESLRVAPVIRQSRFREFDLCYLMKFSFVFFFLFTESLTLDLQSLLLAGTEQFWSPCAFCRGEGAQAGAWPSPWAGDAWGAGARAPHGQATVKWAPPSLQLLPHLKTQWFRLSTFCWPFLSKNRVGWLKTTVQLTYGLSL